MHMSRIERFIYQIESIKNIFDAILTGWSEGYRSALAQKVGRLRNENVPAGQDIHDTTIKEIISEQRKTQASNLTVIDDTEMCQIIQRTCILHEVLPPTFCETIVANCGDHGHRACDTSLRTVTKTY